MNHDTPANPKFAALQTVLGLARYEAVGVLESIWIMTRTSLPQGNIGLYSNIRIAASIGWTGDPDALIDGLVETGWLDLHPEHRLVVHGWAEHAPQYLKRRLNRKGLDFISDNLTSHDYPVTSHELATTINNTQMASHVMNKEHNITEHNISKDSLVGLATDPPAEKYDIEIQEFVEAWNEMASGAGLPTMREIGSRRPELVRRLRSPQWRSDWRSALILVPQSDFLCGRKRGSDYRCTPDFFLKPKSVEKILSGNYTSGCTEPQQPLDLGFGEME